MTQLQSYNHGWYGVSGSNIEPPKSIPKDNSLARSGFYVQPGVEGPSFLSHVLDYPWS